MSIRANIYYPDYLKEQLNKAHVQWLHEKKMRLIKTVGPLVVCFSLVTGASILPSNDDFPSISEISESTAKSCQISNEGGDNYDKLQNCFTPNLLSNIKIINLKKDKVFAGKLALGILALTAFGVAVDNLRKGSDEVDKKKKDLKYTQDNIDSLEQSEKTSFVLARITSNYDLI